MISLTQGIILVLIIIAFYLAFMGYFQNIKEGLEGSNQTWSCTSLGKGWLPGNNQKPMSPYIAWPGWAMGIKSDPSGEGWKKTDSGSFFCPQTACFNNSNDFNRVRCQMPARDDMGDASGINWIESRGRVRIGCSPNMATIDEAGCDVGGVYSTIMGGSLKKCGWQGAVAAKKGCGPWEQCGGFTCVPDASSGFCYAAAGGATDVISIGNTVGLNAYDAFLKPFGPPAECIVPFAPQPPPPPPPINCVWGEWSDWGPCTAKCGEEAKQMSTRERKILVENGGVDCSGNTVRYKTLGCDASNTTILPDIPNDYIATCTKGTTSEPPGPTNPNTIPPTNHLPSPPATTSLLGGLRPPESINNPATPDEDAYNKIIYWQQNRNNDLTTDAINVSKSLVKQKAKNLKNITNKPEYRNYTKPDLRMFPLLESINNSLTKLTS